MKQTEVLDWAMRGVIDAMQREPNEERKKELNQELKELAHMFVIEEHKERE
jgi:hypothetical protein